MPPLISNTTLECVVILLEFKGSAQKAKSLNQNIDLNTSCSRTQNNSYTPKALFCTDSLFPPVFIRLFFFNIVPRSFIEVLS